MESALWTAPSCGKYRSTVVNVDSVAEIHALFHGEYEVVLRDSTRLRMSRGYRAQLASTPP